MSYSAPQTLRFANYLSPLLHETYAAIVRYLGEKLAYPVSLTIGHSTDDFTRDLVDIGFLCGLLYAHTTRQKPRQLAVLAAPVLTGARYGGQPIYFSDLVVRQESPYASFADLRGCRWAYNELPSHSGWNLVHSTLHKRGESPAYFSQLLKSGSHLRSLEMVLAGSADATAIDSHLLDVLRQRDPDLATQLRVIDVFGPSPIPPLAISTRMDARNRQHLQELLTTMHQDPALARIMHQGCIERFVPVNDQDYLPLREMFDLVQELAQPPIP